MAAKIDKRLFGPALLTGAAATKYTCPAGRRAVITHIHVGNAGTGPFDFTLSIGADAAGTRVYDAHPVAEDVPLDAHCKYVLEAAEVIQAFASTTNKLVLTLDGYEEVLA